LLGRDRLGIKPLYYAATAKELAFASEIKALLVAGAVRPEFNKAVLPEFLSTRFVDGTDLGRLLESEGPLAPEAAKRQLEIPRRVA